MPKLTKKRRNCANPWHHSLIPASQQVAAAFGPLFSLLLGLRILLCRKIGSSFGNLEKKNFHFSKISVLRVRKPANKKTVALLCTVKYYKIKYNWCSIIKSKAVRNCNFYAFQNSTPYLIFGNTLFKWIKTWIKVLARMRDSSVPLFNEKSRLFNK